MKEYKKDIRKIEADHKKTKEQKHPAGIIIQIYEK